MDELSDQIALGLIKSKNPQWRYEHRHRVTGFSGNVISSKFYEEIEREMRNNE
jgi:hypothetical protein